MASVAFLALWTLAMAAMMLPSTVPLLRLDYATTASRARVVTLAAGYVSVWLVLAGAIVTLDAALGTHGRRVTAALLLVAAVYQLSPLKRRCLARCRAPLARMLLGWRDGIGGAARMGLGNGAWCAGCCAGLMLALLGLGLMSWLWMSVIWFGIMAEKLAPAGTAAPGFVVLATAAVVWAS